MIDLLKGKKVLYWSLLFFGLEMLSFLVYRDVLLNNLVVILLGIILLIVTFKKPDLGVILVFLELILGGFGYWFTFTFGSHRISERMVFIGVFYLGWIFWRTFKFKEKVEWNKVWNLLKNWLFIFGLVIYGFILGWVYGSLDLFRDVNAWLFLLYIIPVADILLTRSKLEKEGLKENLLNIVLSGLLILSIKVLLVFFLFAHGFLIVNDLYVWIRDTRIGEITPAGGGLYRVFFQSTIYIGLALVVMLGEVWKEKKMGYYFWGIFVLFLSVLIISLSRSFWLAFANLFIVNAKGVVIEEIV